MKEIFISTGNQDKVKEIRDKYSNLPLKILSPSDLDLDLQVAETGKTLAENALLKARAGAEKSSLPTLADDTGLAVEALDGRPGVYSARFAGPEASYQDNNEYLLELLQDVPEGERGAAFSTVVALVDLEQDLEITVTGKLQGEIISKPRGSEGFGYDPIFYLPQKDKTLAEIEMAEKNALSHRAKALEKMKDKLKEIYKLST